MCYCVCEYVQKSIAIEYCKKMDGKYCNSTWNYDIIACLTRLCLISRPLKNPHSIPTGLWGFITVPMPIPYAYPWESPVGISIPTAVLSANCLRFSYQSFCWTTYSISYCNWVCLHHDWLLPVINITRWLCPNVKNMNEVVFYQKRLLQELIRRWDSERELFTTTSYM